MTARRSERNTTEIRIRGLVQGVGFRPTVWRLATELGLNGDVCNDSDGVLIRLAGETPVVEQLIASIKSECPPLARIESIEIRPNQTLPAFEGFVINTSGKGEMNTEVAPDAATCPACLAEIRDPFARRFRYPFTNCTHCGPRLSMICEAPYDRARTTMAPFVMCDECRAEYENPADRRFHAEPIACHRCGPRVSIEKSLGGSVEFSSFSMLDDTDAVAGMLLKGYIVAIKGLGGYHLACDATNPDAVGNLRARKQRYSKPFALMARDLDVTRHYAQVRPEEEEALLSPAAPIVVLERHAANRLPDPVAPGVTTLGFMLPYTPLHHLIFRRLDRPIVMTSGNLSDEPQVIDDDEARQKLSNIADFLIPHDRKIALRLDDSLLRFSNGSMRMLRRARGYAPAPIFLPVGLRGTNSILALGGELKSAFCLVKDGKAIVSQHIGDLEEARSLADFEQNLGLFKQLYAHKPEVIAVDLHPDYLSAKLGGRIARDEKLPLVSVQHHHAHIASVMVENDLDCRDSPVLGIALDGLGYGDEGSLWGGEFLIADYHSYRRVGTFKPVAMPGGSLAAREPWRNTLAHILAEMGWQNFTMNFAETELHDFLRSKPLETLCAMISQGINSPKASSCGRLFDAVAAAIGVCREKATYEGEAAIQLEALADRESMAAVNEDLAYPFSIPNLKGSNLPYIEPAAMWQALCGDLYEHTEASVISARFHKGLSRALAAMACKVTLDGDTRVINKIALSGGVFQNRVLTEDLVPRLEGEGFEVILHSKFPANDGGLSLGQAAVAAARLNLEKKG